MWAAYRDAWLAELPRLPGVGWSPLFRRGFAHGVDFADVRVFVDSADAVFAAAPVRVMDLSGADAVGLEQLAGSPYAGRLAELILLYSRVRALGAFVLATSPRLRGLRLLNLAGNLIGDEGARHLARSTSLANLEALVLSENRIGTAGGRALADSLTLNRSLKLYVRNNDIDPDTLSRLRDRFPRLVT